MYTRMLTQVNDGGLQEINIVMRKASIAWQLILNMFTIFDSQQLLARTIEHSKALVAASRTDSTSHISASDLLPVLRSMGIEPPHKPRFSTPECTVHLASGMEDQIDPPDIGETSSVNDDADYDDLQKEELIKSAFQVLKTRQRPPPKKYFFPISNKETNLEKLPPSPCKVCSSPKHWDKECPYWEKYLEKVKNRSAWLAALHLNESMDLQNAYQLVYQALADQTNNNDPSGEWPDSIQKQDFDLAAPKDSSLPEKSAEILNIECKTTNTSNFETELSEPGSSFLSQIKALPTPLKPRHIPRQRHHDAGHSAIGISVLAVEGWIGNPRNTPVLLHHDSGADVSLLSWEYYQTLTNPPRIKKGAQMKLWQLTDKDADIEGYVTMPIFTLTENGELIETEVESYLVPDMSVPILLGEDYQQNYELTVKCNLENGVTILYGDNPELMVKATGVDKSQDFDRMRASVNAVQSFVKSKEHHRRKNQRRRQSLKEKQEEQIIQAKKDTLIPAQHSKLVEVEGPFQEEKEWVVERNLIPNSPTSYFTIPNVLIISSHPKVPISNPTDSPKFIRKGDIIGTIHPAKDHFDIPVDEAQSEAIERTALLAKQIIQEN
ncbi:uncharacterized protein ARMOST_11415 [Armillaria ostoyae]|uniref:Uncharacterized protein n=1 Tax=Armillaria ostoyae TaxID=47428 RepID=A0A284RH27_ARMOS|nr:uncharacterized protein ARMOST_11415 [Armillaria ostoyae]